ncbi:MFS general substrate transporter [Ephemerocybe angulata]|uniref:MFS general substrate transporter n=1 Tax=Ephemerocybe angulata TaxID=980116 RepID=A0A8H6IBY9_9AGAR|nr:MFS general substrate transporter [Tulosesus angulatus]
MSILVLIYILNYIDRNNAAAARLRGFQGDLGLSDRQFATVLSVLYIGYTMMQIPSNMFLNHIGRPSIYLPICMIIWGAISICTGIVSSSGPISVDYFGALCTRFFLGFVEAAFFPGALFLLSKCGWLLLSCGSLLSNAFGALIASGILDAMDNVLGYTAWRWLFFVEGTLTIIVAVWAIYVLPDFPETTTGWLTPAEQALAVKRMAEDAGTRPGSDAHGKAGQFNGLSLAICDSKVWFLALGLTCFVLSLSFNAYFPTLTATLGFNPTITLLLCSPPWLVATVLSILVSRHSDQKGERCMHIVIPLLIGIVGFAIAMSTMNLFFRYISLFYSGFICFLAWASSSVSQPSSKRAVALALINCVSQSGNILGSYAWPSSWGPSYNKSYAITAFFNTMTIVLCFGFRRHLVALNQAEEKKDAERPLEEEPYRYML